MVEGRSGRTEREENLFLVGVPKMDVAIYVEIFARDAGPRFGVRIRDGPI